MDVTPQVLHDVEFRSKVRGYDPDEVDDFLERVAVAVGDLQARLRDALERADAAEAHAAEIERQGRTREPGDADETLRRTLVLAQRTADAAIKEAEETAARTVHDAQEQVERMLAEARDQAGRIVGDAETDARRAAEDTKQRLVAEVRALEQTRDALESDVHLLERHTEEQRLRLRSSLGELQRMLDEPGGLRVEPMPPLSGATAPVVEQPAPAAVPDDDLLEAPLPPVSFEPLAAEPDQAVGPPESAAPSEPVEVDADPLLGPLRPGHEIGGRLGIFDEKPTQAVPAVGLDDDAYLDELRKAMVDDTSAPTDSSVFDQDTADEHRGRGRFGRRR